MDQRRIPISQWVAHLPDLLSQGQRDRSCAPVETGGNKDLITEWEASHEIGSRVEGNIQSQTERAVDPLMDEAIRIYKSYIWGCKNLSWLFSERVPEWLDTAPAEWHAVKRILQEFKHNDFIRQFSRAKKEVETEHTEVYYSDSESTDSYDFLDVRIVCRKDSSQNLKSCLKIQSNVHLFTNVIKMVIVGGVDIELFALTEAEIDWKIIPLSLERVEVNGKYIRDISKREMDVRKLYELDLNTVKTIDGEDLATLESRRELCELYNQKLRVQLADYSLPTLSELPSGDHVLEQSGEISKEVLLKEVERVIPPHKSTKHMMIDRMKEANRPQWRNGQSTNDRRVGNTAHSLTIVTKTGDYDKPTSEPIETPAAENHTDDLITVPRKIEGSTTIFARHNLQRLEESLDDLLYDTKATIQHHKKEAHREITSPALALPLDELPSQNKAIKQANETKAIKQVIPSSSVQSLDDLINEALEAEEELERRRAETSSRKLKSPPIHQRDIAKLKIVNESLAKREQSFQSLSNLRISPLDKCGILTIPDHTVLLKEYKEATANALLADLALHDLHIASKHGGNTDRILATADLQSKGSQRALGAYRVRVVHGETPSRKFSGEKVGHLEYCERPKSCRGCTVPRETYSQIPIKCSPDNNVQKKVNLKKDLSPSRCWSNLSLFSELSADDWVLLRQRNTDMSKSATTINSGLHISSEDRSHEKTPDRTDCRHLTIPQERSRDNQLFKFFRRNFSTFRRNFSLLFKIINKYDL